MGGGGLTLILSWLMAGRMGGGIHGGKAKGFIARETAGAPKLLRAFFKGSEVTKAECRMMGVGVSQRI